MLSEIVNGVNIIGCKEVEKALIDPPEGVPNNWYCRIGLTALTRYSKFCKSNKDCPFKQKERLKLKNRHYIEVLKKIETLISSAISIPCGSMCTYPECEDEVTECGKFCMEVKINEVKKLCTQVLKDTKI